MWTTRGFGVVLFLAGAAGGTHVTGGAEDVDLRVWLEPCRPLHLAGPDSRNEATRLWAVLQPFVSEAGPVWYSAIVEPSFEPEWSVAIAHHEDKCTVTYAVASDNVYYSDKDDDGATLPDAPLPTANKHSAVIPCDLAGRIEDLWDALLRRPRVPDDNDPRYLDGTSWTLLKQKPGRWENKRRKDGMPRCGEAHSPPEGSPADAFTVLCDVLRDHVIAPAATRAESMKKVTEQVGRLERLVRSFSPTP